MKYKNDMFVIFKFNNLIIYNISLTLDNTSDNLLKIIKIKLKYIL